MRKTWGVFCLIVAVSAFMMAASAQDSSTPEDADHEALVERGEYLANVTGCISCHTPYKEEYSDFSALTEEQLLHVSLESLTAQDVENRPYAGGRVFDLGPMGIVITRNLTPDPETGLGNWTDEEIEAAIRVGISRDGRRLLPVMPYANYFNMAASDMEALIAYLRTLEPVVNEIPVVGPSAEGIAPELILDEDGILAEPPGADDELALGEYMITMMSCTDCHTPLDAEIGMPDFTKFLAGGQAYEGPWGIVYGGNITPHEETGIGNWEAEEIERAIREGVRIDGRRLILMPWQDYAVITDEDLQAAIAYLQSLDPIENEVPAPAIDELFIQHADEE